jgi:hypothetical protein
MKTKTTLGTLIAAAAFAASGLAMAQADPPSSTAGNNCTATGNAMKGGNMSANPSKTACGTQGSANTAAAVSPSTTSTTTADSATSASTAGTTAMGNTTAPSAKPMRVAKADRN